MWSLRGRAMHVRVVDVYDADTITFVAELETGFYKFKGRVHGIDACEMKSKLDANRETAHVARNRLLQLCGVPCVSLDRVYAAREVQAMLEADVFLVWLRCGDFDKYGRPLVEVFGSDADVTSFGDVLISEGLAFPYFGSTKLTESQQAQVLAALV